MSTNATQRQESDEPTTELPTDPEAVTVADTGAGLLVFVEADLPGKELAGFADVSDWGVIRDALQHRGLGVGATTNLPVFPVEAIPSETNSRPEPTRSEPADFGGGETTGVQDL